MREPRCRIIQPFAGPIIAYRTWTWSGLIVGIPNAAFGCAVLIYIARSLVIAGLPDSASSIFATSLLAAVGFFFLIMAGGMAAFDSGSTVDLDAKTVNAWWRIAGLGRDRIESMDSFDRVVLWMRISRGPFAPATQRYIVSLQRGKRK